MKTAEGVAKFEAIATQSADLVLKYGGALSGEHGDGLVRGPFMEKMFGSALYHAFRTVKHTFDPQGVFNPGKIVDCPPLTTNLRYGAGYKTPDPPTYFDYSEYGGFGRAVEMCSGVGACRKKLEGTMCPSYMATRDERDVTRGRANTLRLAMTGPARRVGPRRRGRARDARPLSRVPRVQGRSVPSAWTSRGSRASSSPSTGEARHPARQARARQRARAVEGRQPVRAAGEHAARPAASAGG
jgi:hypothetical protein